MFLHFAVATHKTKRVSRTVGMLPSSWNFVGVPTSFHSSSFQVLANFSPLSTTPPIRIPKTELRGITIEQLLVVSSRLFLLNLAQGSQKGASDFHCEIRNPDILRGWLHWWILWKILLRSGVRRMKILPTTQIFWILRHSICTTPLSGSLNQLPYIDALLHVSPAASDTST